MGKWRLFGLGIDIDGVGFFILKEGNGGDCW